MVHILPIGMAILYKKYRYAMSIVALEWPKDS